MAGPCQDRAGSGAFRRADWLPPLVLRLARGRAAGFFAQGALAITTGQTQAQQFTKPVESVTGQVLLNQYFPAVSSGPADIYVPSGGATAALAAAQHVPGVSSASAVASSGGWTHITAVLTAAPDTAAARQTVASIRTALSGAPGQARFALVGGPSAVTLDTYNAEAAEEHRLFPIILGVVLIMLILLLRALVAPVLLVLAAVLSFAAAVGTASLLAATFCALTVIPTVGSLQEGLLVAVGVLLDALLVRSLLVPALALDVGPRIWRPGHPERLAPRPSGEAG